MIYCYKWPLPDCIFRPVTDAWEIVSYATIHGKPCAILKKKPCKRK